jgi:hypothetical protein
MNNNLNFATQYFPKVNELKKWVDDEFYPYIKKMIQRKNSFRIYEMSDNNGNLSIKDKNNIDISNFNRLVKELDFFKHKAGIYGVYITDNTNSAYIYIGKSKDLSDRVRQHLTGKNKNETDIASTTHHKYKEICELVTNKNIKVSFFIWTNKKLTDDINVDYYLGALEALFIAKTKNDFEMLDKSLNLKHWNLRIG